MRGAFERNDTPYTTGQLIVGTMSAERPLLPAPHQIVGTFAEDIFGWPVTSPRSLVYHGWVTLSATFVGFLLGATFGIILAVLIVHVRTLAEEPLALDHLLADGADPRGGAHRHRRARRDRAARAPAEGDHLGLSVFFPGRHRRGERPDVRPIRSSAT